MDPTSKKIILFHFGSFMKENRLKKALNEGKFTVGTWVSMCSPLGAEALGLVGFDWLLIDMEHGSGDYQTLLHQLQAVECAGQTTPVVRVQWNDANVLKRVLDLGATSVMVPGVRSVDEARRAVEALRYPPEGIRGIAPVRAGKFGLDKDYLKQANDNMCLFLQIETREAVEQAAEILALPGIDVAFIGPNDLAADLGHTGDMEHPEVLAAIEKVEQAAQDTRVALGTISSGWDQARGLVERGYRAMSIQSDFSFLLENAQAAVKNFRNHPYVTNK